MREPLEMVTASPMQNMVHIREKHTYFVTKLLFWILGNSSFGALGVESPHSGAIKHKLSPNQKHRIYVHLFFHSMARGGGVGFLFSGHYHEDLDFKPQGIAIAPDGKYGWTRRGGSPRTTSNIPEKKVRPERRFGPTNPKYSLYIFWNIQKIDPLSIVWKCWRCL